MSKNRVSSAALEKVIVHDHARAETRVRGTGPDIRFLDELNDDELISAIAGIVCINARNERKRARARRKARRGWA